MGSAVSTSLSILTSIVGVICLGAGIIGYFFKKAPIHERLLLFAAALLLINPGLLTDLIGLICSGLVIFLQLKRSPDDSHEKMKP